MSDLEVPKSGVESASETAVIMPPVIDGAVTEGSEGWLQTIIEPLRQAVNAGTCPELLELGGEESYGWYGAVFDCVYRRDPIFDPERRVIVFEEDACQHVCFCEPRFEKGERCREGKAKIRDCWGQSRADHILWILPALTTPCLIAHNNQQDGNLAYLLGFPKNSNYPTRRYYASVRPTSRKRAIFKTAYPIDQRGWDQALRVPRHHRCGPHVLYRAPIPGW